MQCWIHSLVQWDFNYALVTAVNPSPSLQLEARLKRTLNDHILHTLCTCPLTVPSNNIIEYILGSDIWSPTSLQNDFTTHHRQVSLSTCEVHSTTEMPAYSQSPFPLSKSGFPSRSWNISNCWSLPCWLFGIYKPLLYRCHFYWLFFQIYYQTLCHLGRCPSHSLLQYITLIFKQYKVYMKRLCFPHMYCMGGLSNKFCGSHFWPKSWLL